ncbi:MAG: IS110 family transposase [Mesorhizobium sp.]|uniref:transposase n=1 Tax=Mesorhizobium sp. TaxID=1871066 RepID=UPI000FE89BF1|nr:transposase [Mesorhizobium sp.]RWK71852.1 MAG: IS110 family transposase [Mesorhizobium sp.]
MPVMDAERRLQQVEEQILSLIPEWNQRPVVDALQAMRGIALINAVVLVAEVGDFTRFSNPRQLMAYFGLVPGEQSSGETVWRGGITKTGNAHARRALVEGAWAYRMRPRIGRHKVDRIEALPKVVRDIGWKAQVRLCTRYRRLSARQERQRRQRRHRTRDGRLHLVDRLHGSIPPKAAWPVFERQPAQETANRYQPRRGMRCWRRDNAGSPRLHYEPDARHLDRGSPKRHKVMRPRPADERLLTDVQVLPLAPHIRRASASTADRVGGQISTPKAVCQQS